MGLGGAVKIFSQTITYLINDKAVYRTAPATPCLLISVYLKNVGQFFGNFKEKIETTNNHLIAITKSFNKVAGNVLYIVLFCFFHLFSRDRNVQRH